jgi:SAM-dependent methyltransferase
MTTVNHTYYDHLSSRSLLGYLYRQYFVYPRVSARLQGRALDVGCGLGQFLQFRLNTEGVDVNSRCIQHCKARGLKVHLIGNTTWPLEDKAFDSVIMDNVLEHISEPSSTILEIRRVLKPNGILIVGVPGIKGYAFDKDHKVHYDRKLLDSVLDEHGFSSLEHFYTPAHSEFLNQKLKQYCLYGVFRMSRFQ